MRFPCRHGPGRPRYGKCTGCDALEKMGSVFVIGGILTELDKPQKSSLFKMPPHPPRGRLSIQDEIRSAFIP